MMRRSSSVSFPRLLALMCLLSPLGPRPSLAAGPAEARQRRVVVTDIEAAKAALLGLVSAGLPVYGMAGVGPGHDSAGSDLIIRALERAVDRPLWIAVWGGANTLAQALHKLQATRSPADVRRLVAKLRVYTISDQDDSGARMRRTFPQLFYIVSPGGYGKATWGGTMAVVDGIDKWSWSSRDTSMREILDGIGPDRAGLRLCNAGCLCFRTPEDCPPSCYPT